MAREELATVEDEISKLNGEMSRIKHLPAHKEDIAAALMRGLDDAAKAFKRQLGIHLNRRNIVSLQAASSVAEGSGQLLTLEVKDREDHQLIPGRLVVTGASLSVAALTYFLRDKIAAEIPNLVAEFCTGTLSGMKETEREAKRRELQAQLEVKTQRRDELKAILAEVQTSIYRRI